jgi:hypothetical protein
MNAERDGDELPEPGPLYVRGETCECGQPLRFDAAAAGLTVGGLHRRGWWICAACGRGYLPDRATLAAHRADIEAAEANAQRSEPWALAKGGLSLTAGGIKVRAEAKGGDVRELMARLVRLPELEAEVATLRAELQRRAEPTRLERAALAIGDLFAADIDPGWDEAQELEAAALEYRNAYRAREAKRAEENR